MDEKRRSSFIAKVKPEQADVVKPMFDTIVASLAEPQCLEIPDLLTDPFAGDVTPPDVRPRKRTLQAHVSIDSSDAVLEIMEPCDAVVEIMEPCDQPVPGPRSSSADKGLELALTDEMPPRPSLKKGKPSKKKPKVREGRLERLQKKVPRGWKVIAKSRQSGRSIGKEDCYFVAPWGEQFRSLRAVSAVRGFRSAVG